jgi:hypothetical protein
MSSHFVIARRTKSDAAIYRVSEDAGVLSLRVVRTSGSPRAYALAMTRVGGFVL